MDDKRLHELFGTPWWEIPPERDILRIAEREMRENAEQVWSLLLRDAIVAIERNGAHSAALWMVGTYNKDAVEWSDYIAEHGLGDDDLYARACKGESWPIRHRGGYISIVPVERILPRGVRDPQVWQIEHWLALGGSFWLVGPAGPRTYDLTTREQDDGDSGPISELRL